MFFRVMDPTSEYWQVAMRPKDSEKTAIITRLGLFEWIVMPF